MIDEQLCVSADSHLEVTPDVWSGYVAEKYRDYAPRHIRLANGADGFLVEGRPIYHGGMNLFAGSSPEEWNPQGLMWTVPGTKGPKERLEEQDLDGVDAEVIFPGVGGRTMWGGIRDNDAYHDIVRAYNEYIGQEYAAESRDRIITTGVIPERGIDEALVELDHCTELGLKAIVLSKYPTGKSFPTSEDDRFWSEVLDRNMPITIHQNFDHDPSEPKFVHPRKPNAAEHVADPTDRLYRYGFRGALNAIQLIISGVFDRFPSLRVYFAENEVGWLPVFFEQADHNYKRHHFWAERAYGWPKLQQLPSEYIREHCSWGFFNDEFGVQVRHAVGVDKMMWGSDFPHVESDWPHSAELLTRHFKGVPAEERYKVIAGNAISFFHLEEWATRLEKGVSA